MQLVERHVIKRAEPRFAPIDAAAHASKNLYNAANCVVRQSVIAEGVYLNCHEMRQRMKDAEFTLCGMPYKPVNSTLAAGNYTLRLGIIIRPRSNAQKE